MSPYQHDPVSPLSSTRLYSRSVHVLRRERPRGGDLQLSVRQTIHPQQLQGGAAHHQDGGGGETLHSPLRGSGRLAEALGLLDDSGGRNILRFLQLSWKLSNLT